MDQEELAAFNQLNVLIIDDQILVQNVIKSALFELGIENVKCAENAYYGLRLCEQTTFHVVICAFNVKSDKDGFHLLEELKFKRYVTKCTVLIFLSAETNEDLVNSIVELQPDDFWVKPLNIKHVQTRLPLALEVKRTLFNVYQAMDRQDFSKAIYYAERHLLNNRLAKYHLQMKRLKGECLLQLREYTDATQYYANLLQTHKVSWVYLGYIKSLLQQDKLEDIQALLTELTDKADTRFATYDMLAHYYVGKQDYAQAYEEIKKATRLAPRNIERNKRLLDLARLNHDHAGQYQATISMAKFARNSIHDSPLLRLNVVRAAIDYATTLEKADASKVLSQGEVILAELEKQLPLAAQLKDQLLVVRARLHTAREERQKAESIVDNHMTLRPGMSVEDNLDKVKALHELGRREDAVSLLDAIKRQISGSGLTNQVVSKYIEQEAAERSAVHFTPQQLNRMAVEFFKRNKFHAALNSLEQAFSLTPNNMSVALNILKVLVAIKQQEALDEGHIALVNNLRQQLAHNELDSEQQSKFAEYQQQLLPGQH
ncbi:response regulator [Rheinheimera maricola]|uniref:Response regulator n=1 Tax=Rheinheimera maricola TaxID=2793282 RepID=A0ABS7X661_9GAMM|nr:response regulator [Rheinheimera maricola]MBZ9610640.1 response regulator [Rheinheimera maricola]